MAVTPKEREGLHVHNWLSRLPGYVTGAFFVLAIGGLFLVPHVVNLIRTLNPEPGIGWLTTWLVVGYLATLSLPFFTGGFLGYRYGQTKEATAPSWITVRPR